ncbi:alginate O-acetyltransferase AlgF [Roseibium salinum]|uniref:Alginate O-acetyltransferase AlgF n=1 Tax=Roseibium salinum TaxID=1604349 RepID=A0ABT3QWN6_9HYPH|nr:alginate O-acetyltransferase AlgF [Roseibium sp. DSM 29163]MCX2721341.1 alginate O-acetyltransferase AlgF [Roseibium sp. DSM 29163]
MTAPLNRLLATLAVVAALGGTAMAQDDALYPEPSAPDASYLRILTDAGTETEIDGNAAEAGEAGLTRYYEVSPGEVELRIAGRTISVQPGANAHYTYVAAGDQGELMSDEITDSPANADLVFYNLTDLDGVEVYVPEAEAVALEGVGPLKTASVALQAPMTLDFVIRNGEGELGSTEAVELRRGTATSLVLRSDGDAYRASAVTSTYAQ